LGAIGSEPAEAEAEGQTVLVAQKSINLAKSQLCHEYFEVLIMLMLILTLLAAQPSGPQKTRPPSVADRPIPAESTAAKPATGSHPIIEASLQNGRYIRLSDDSLWEINPSDRPITQSWITPVEIVAAPSNDANYPFRLTNTLTGSSVLARRATAVPKAAPQTTLPTPK
jgi:hypothetical protein